jgi:predicted 2-oxoglutarate/Fe(II)-dependent dioxygenase YbiX
MKLLEPFQLFDRTECKQIIRLAQQQEVRPGLAAGQYVPEVRTNRIYWYDHPDPGKFFHILSQFEEYPVTWVQEPFQVSRYDSGTFYDWHADQFKNKRTSARLLTLTCTLQCASGAAFETRDQRYELKEGEAILFPATLEHRATAPVIGTRWAFTVWGMGPNPLLSQS